MLLSATRKVLLPLFVTVTMFTSMSNGVTIQAQQFKEQPQWDGTSPVFSIVDGHFTLFNLQNGTAAATHSNVKVPFRHDYAVSQNESIIESDSFDFSDSKPIASTLWDSFCECSSSLTDQCQLSFSDFMDSENWTSDVLFAADSSKLWSDSLSLGATEEETSLNLDEELQQPVESLAAGHHQRFVNWEDFSSFMPAVMSCALDTARLSTDYLSFAAALPFQGHGISSCSNEVDCSFHTDDGISISSAHGRFELQSDDEDSIPTSNCVAKQSAMISTSVRELIAKLIGDNETEVQDGSTTSEEGRVSEQAAEKREL